MIVRVPSVSTHSLKLHCARQRVKHNSMLKILIHCKNTLDAQTCEAYPSFHIAPWFLRGCQLSPRFRVICERCFKQADKCEYLLLPLFLLGRWCLISEKHDSILPNKTPLPNSFSFPSMTSPFFWRDGYTAT